MKNVYLKQRITHLVDWARTFVFILKKRGVGTFGAVQVRDLLERHILEYATDLEELNEAKEAIYEITNLLTLHRVNGLQRIGPAHDGGYIGLWLDETPVVLSGGGGKNIDFEIELAMRGSQVHLYDPTIKRLPKSHPLVTHFKQALCGSGDKQFNNSVTLRESLSRLAKDSPGTKWLKLDIEGSEIKLLANDLSLLPEFTQIFIEFHNSYKLIDSTYRRQFLSILRKLSEDFYLIAINSNNWQGITNFGDAFMPVTFEVTYLSKKLPIEITNENNYESLRYPNNSRRPGIPSLPFRRNE